MAISEKIARPVDQIVKIVKMRIIAMFAKQVSPWKMANAQIDVWLINAKFAQMTHPNVIFVNKVDL